MMKPHRRWLRKCQSKGQGVVLLILLLSACQGGQIPDLMIGTWMTDHPEYENCFLKITPARIIVGDKEGKNNDSYIKKVSTKKHDHVTEVDITYVDDQEASHTVVLLYSNEDNRLLIFKNQPHVIWKRSESIQ